MLIQILLAAFGLTALLFAQGNDPARRKWAPIIGLAGQPFWFAATIPTEQWGMVCLCIAYTLVYVQGIRLQWGHA